jgi:outer membrane protein OmpA-like peptidoglycan-associated protein
MKRPGKPEGAGKVFAPTPVRLNRAQGGRPPGQHVSSHGGREIEPRVRASFEAKLGHDFSSVRVHDGDWGAGVASGLKAQAVTAGTDVYFNAGRYAPHAREGAALLGHELAHVAQQARGGRSPDAEGRADKAAAALAKGEAIAPEALGGAPFSLQAKPDPNALAPDGVVPNIAVTKTAVPNAALQNTAAPNAPVPNSAVSKAAVPNDQLPAAPAGAHLSNTLDRFGFDSDALTADHQKAIDSLAADIASRIRLAAGKATIAITGHTDTAGSEDYNKRLGLRRADKVMAAVRDALKKQGVMDTQIPAITASSAGEGTPSVPTKDNVKEPRNRRVDVNVTITGGVSTTPPPKLPIGGFILPQEPLAPTPKPLPGPRAPNVQAPSREWVKDHFEHDPLLRGLPKFARDQLVTALKDGDELAATAIIGSLNLGDKTAPVTAAVKALLEMLKGRTYKPPPTPPVQPDFGPPRTLPPVPGQKILTLPPINLPKPFN